MENRGYVDSTPMRTSIYNDILHLLGGKYTGERVS